MSFTRSLLALTFGFGVLLPGCIVDSDDDLLEGTPSLRPLEKGTGVNGVDPGPDCIRGVANAMTMYQGFDPNVAPIVSVSGTFPFFTLTYTDAHNPALKDVECLTGTVIPGLINNVADRTDAIEAMAWIGAFTSYAIKDGNGNPFFGNGWFSQNWATSPLPTSKKDIIGGLYAAKWNKKTVQIMVEADGIDGSATQWSVDPATEYTVRESMFVYNPDDTTSRQPFLLFVAQQFKSECEGWYQYFNERMCHNSGVSGCGLTYLQETDVSTHCTDVHGQPANSIATAFRCLDGNYRPVKVSVKFGDISNDTMCNPLH